MIPFNDLQGIVFDLDGVLADTETLSFHSLQDTVSSYHITLSDEDFHALYGIDYTATAEYLIGKYHLKDTVESFMERQIGLTIERIKQEIEPYPEVVGILQDLSAAGTPLGLASNSPASYVETALREMGIRQYFTTVIPRDAVENGKPAPDPYLAACAGLGIDPVHSLAVEDSSVGLESALRAGMWIALVGEHPIPDIPVTDRLVRYPSMVEFRRACVQK